MTWNTLYKWRKENKESFSECNTKVSSLFERVFRNISGVRKMGSRVRRVWVWSLPLHLCSLGRESPLETLVAPFVK